LAQPSFSPASLPILQSQPLLSDQRLARAEYWLSRRGLQFGVPPGAYNAAVTEMHVMEASQEDVTTSSVFGSRVSPTWNFIGPQPMLNALANFGGVILPIGNGDLGKFSATGRIIAIATDPTTPGRLFVGAANGGVWMSTDGGSTFTPIGDALPTQAIGAIVLDPVNTSPPTLYVATGEAHNTNDSYYGQGIFRSDDLGATWMPLSPGTFDRAAFAQLAIDTSQNPPILFAATGSGVSGGRANPPFVASDRTKNGLWKSTDGGNSWTQYAAATFRCGLSPDPSTTPCPATDVRFDPQNPSDVYVAIRFANVFISHDGGTTFTAACFTNDTPCSFPSALNQMDRQSLAVGPPTPDAPLACAGGTRPCGTLYAMLGALDAGEYVGFFTSIDGGATWIAASVPSVTFPTNPPITIDGTTRGNSSQEFYDQALLVSPADPATVFFGGVGIYASTDAGDSWTFLAQNGGVHADQHALALDADQDTVYVGNDGGVFKFSLSKISGGGATFAALNDTLGVGQIQSIGPHPTSNTTVLAGFQDNGTDLYSGDIAWLQPETGDGGFALFDHSNPSFAYHTFSAGGTSVRLGASSDGGSTWVQFIFSDPVGFGFYPPLASDPAVAQRVLLGGHFVLVFDFATRTVTRHSPQDLTGGCTSGACALQDLEFAPSDHTIAWALSKQSGTTPFKLFNTTQADLNSGATWNDVTGNLPFNSASTQATGIAPDPHDANNAYLSISGFTAVTGVGHIFKTTDFGTTWTRADGAGGRSPLPDVPVLRVLVDRREASHHTQHTLYAATDVGVFQSSDGGETWAAFNLGVIPAVPVYDIEQNDNGVIYVGTHGRGAYQLIPQRPQKRHAPAVSSIR
jgi:photosystem II stability/assembly factor-like uncharacterized protein